MTERECLDATLRALRTLADERDRYRAALQAIVDQRCTINNCECGWCPGHCTRYWQTAYDALEAE